MSNVSPSSPTDAATTAEGGGDGDLTSITVGILPIADLAPLYHAIDQGYFVARHTEDLALPGGQSLRASGKQIRVRAVDLATVRDGKIVQHDFYFDQLDFLTQLGLTSAAGEPRGSDAAGQSG